jgi:hypothetical protein
LTRLLGAAAVAVVSVLFAAACATADNPSASTSASAPPTATSPPSQKLAQSLAAKLPGLQADQPVRLVAMLEPGVPTDQIRDEVTRLGGKLIERFTIIEAVSVEVPARNVLALAALPQIRGLELDDTGVPPPSPK